MVVVVRGSGCMQSLQGEGRGTCILTNVWR